MRTRRFILALVAVLAAISLFASCGGEDQGLSEEASAGGLGGSGRGDPADDPTVTNDDPIVTNDDPDDPSAGESADFCGLWSEFASSLESWGADGETADDRRATHEQFEATADDLVAAAPDDIADDVESLVDATAALLDVYEEHDYDVEDAESDPAIDEASGEVFDAYGRVSDYAAANCAGSSEPAEDTPVTADTVAPPDSGSGTGTGSAESDEFCVVWNEFATVDTAAGASPEELRDLYADFDEKAEQFVDAAPDEIRADAETVADASRAMRDLLEEYDYDFSAASLDPAFAEAFNEDALDASLRVADYAIANC